MDHRQFELLKQKVGSKYQLATLIMKRMRELQSGMPPLILDTDGMNDEDIAIQEIIEDKIRLLIGKAALAARQEMLVDEPDSTPVQWTDNLLTSN